MAGLRSSDLHLILAALPVLWFGLSLLYFAASDGWRLAFIKAAVLWGLLVVANTEVLSLLGALSISWLAAAWAVECCGAGFGLWWRRVELAKRLRLPARDRLWHPILLAVVPVLAIAAATAVTAWIAPPNTWDSMTYHMARVAHWVADESVAAYPTNIPRQLFRPPMAEYAVLQLQVLSGGDHLANLVQWFSMVGSVIGASLIAQQLGAPLRGQMLAAIVVATLPMGILQASSTQTDYVVGLWAICSVALALSFAPRPAPQGAAWLASSLGLAMLTKGTGYIVAVPVVLLIGLWMATRSRGRLISTALLLVAIPLVINSAYFIRNEVLFHDPLASHEEAVSGVNARYTPQAVVSNAIRDVVSQLGTTDPRLNHWLERAVAKAHSQVLHIAVDDPATTWPGGFSVNALSFNEDYAGDPLHTLLAIATVLAAFVIAFRRGPPLLLAYSAGLVVAFLIFAAYLKWEPWITRLELPLLVLSAPLIGAVAARASNAAVVGVLGAVLLVASLPWVIDNQTRPMVDLNLPTPPSLQVRSLPAGQTIFNTPRTDLYFVNAKSLQAPYLGAAARAVQTGCREIAFWGGNDDWEYPLWILATQPGGRTRVDQVFVTNRSIDASRHGSNPCLLVAVVPEQLGVVDLDGTKFTQIWIQEGVGLYEPITGS